MIFCERGKVRRRKEESQSESLGRGVVVPIFLEHHSKLGTGEEFLDFTLNFISLVSFIPNKLIFQRSPLIFSASTERVLPQTIQLIPLIVYVQESGTPWVGAPGAGDVSIEMKGTALFVEVSNGDICPYG